MRRGSCEQDSAFDGVVSSHAGRGGCWRCAERPSVCRPTLTKALQSYRPSQLPAGAHPSARGASWSRPLSSQTSAPRGGRPGQARGRGRACGGGAPNSSRTARAARAGLISTRLRPRNAPTPRTPATPFPHLGPRGGRRLESLLLAPAAGAEAVVVEVENKGYPRQLVDQQEVLHTGECQRRWSGGRVAGGGMDGGECKPKGDGDACLCDRRGSLMRSWRVARRACACVHARA